MVRLISKSILLLTLTVGLCCGIYPLVVWVVAQTMFPFQANGSLLTGPDGTVVGSKLIAQPFTKDEYFQPRPSAASYDASASASSALAPSNYLLRDRVARVLGPIVKYKEGAKSGQLVGPDVEAWFGEDRFRGEPHLVAQWADTHNALAQAWVKADPGNAAAVDAWAKDHTDAALAEVPADLVTTSGSGLDPDITLENARYQLDRVAAAWAQDTKREPAAVRNEIDQLLAEKAHAPLGGLWGVDMVNVLEVNLELRKRYGEPGGGSPA